MKITMKDGQATVEAEDLGPLLGLAPADVQEQMRNGTITSRFETGVGEDAGRYRLTFHHQGRRVRLTCTGDGTVLTTTRTSDGRTK